MLHKINRPNYFEKMEYILEIQQKFLCFICDSSLPSELDEDLLNMEFKENGSWIYKNLWKKDRAGTKVKSEFYRDIISFNNLIRSNPDKKDIIINSFKNDIKFHTHLNNSDFRFYYNVYLDNSVKNAIKPLMLIFYSFLESGLILHIDGNDFIFRRDVLITSFFESNPDLEVCPACDGQRPDKIDIKFYADCDHFLPKSKYPFLSVHPDNLVPLCMECNQRFKSINDPIDDHNDAPLVNSFHRYGTCAYEQTNIKVVSNEMGEKHVLIEDKIGMPSRRVNNLNRVFKLEKRWQDRLRQSVESITEELRGAARKINQYRGTQLGRAELTIELESMLAEKTKLIGKRQFYVLHTSYLRYALADNNEFESLLELFTEDVTDAI